MPLLIVVNNVGFDKNFAIFAADVAVTRPMLDISKKCTVASRLYRYVLGLICCFVECSVSLQHNNQTNNCVSVGEIFEGHFH